MQLKRKWNVMERKLMTRTFELTLVVFVPVCSNLCNDYTKQPFLKLKVTRSTAKTVDELNTCNPIVTE